MAEPIPAPFARSLRAALGSALFAAVAVAVVDVAVAAARATEPVPAFALVRALEAAVGLYGAAALVAGLFEGLIAGGIAATLPARAFGRWLDGVRSSAETDRAWAAGLVAAALAAAVVGVLVGGYALAVGFEMARKLNGAITTATVAMAALPLGALAWFPLYRLSRHLTWPLPRPRALVVLGAMAVAVAAAALLALGSVDWRVIDFGPAKAAALFVLFQVGHLAFWSRGWGARLAERAGARSGRLVALGLALTTGLCLAVTWLRFGDEPRSIALVAEESMGTKVLLRLARRLSDRDHDGYAARLGGGDCDDHDPLVHPGADDVPGNGRDEDCDGEDTPLPVAGAPEVRTADKGAARDFTWKGNLLVVTVDTLRADRLNPHTMPRTAALAHRSAVFSHTYAQAPNTPRSFPSFLASRFPSQVKWARLMADFPLLLDAPENTTFFKALHDAGLYTVGVFSHFYMQPRRGISHGFDVWENDGALTIVESNTDVAAPRITPRVVRRLQELGRSKKRFVLWTHLFEPHSRYMDHPEFPVHGSGFEALEARYDGEVAFTDSYIGKILDALAESGLGENTAVVVFSDHGEAFGEHRFGGERMFFHGQTLYDELLHVPLLIYVPGLPARTIDTPVMLVDLGPTLLDLVKAPVPPTFQGRSLLGAILGEPLTPEPVYAELLPTPSWNHAWRAIMDGDLKLIQKLSENTAELYDLGKDPKEQQNLAGSDGGRAAQLKRVLSQFLAREKRG
jgi:arylsulfatase A-like enzyme